MGTITWKIATQPLCVGFGISAPEQAGQVARIADGGDCGQSQIQLMEADKLMVNVENFARELRHALDESPEEKKL